MAGRKPLPSNVTKMRGTQRKCRVNQSEPKPQSDGIRMPPGLSPEAKRHWRATVALLKEAGIMTVLDVPALKMLAQTMARYEEANEKLGTALIVKTSKGTLVQSPYLQIANKCHEQIHKLLVEFGMTPSSRTKVARADGDDSVDPWADFGSQAS